MKKEFTPDDPRHGTYAGAGRHRTAGVPMCEACREAYNTEHRERRARDPKALASSRMSMRARSRALQRLADMNRDEYVRLYAQELGRLRAESS